MKTPYCNYRFNCYQVMIEQKKEWSTNKSDEARDGDTEGKGNDDHSNDDDFNK